MIFAAIVFTMLGAAIVSSTFTKDEPKSPEEVLGEALSTYLKQVQKQNHQSDSVDG